LWSCGVRDLFGNIFFRNLCFCAIFQFTLPDGWGGSTSEHGNNFSMVTPASRCRYYALVETIFTRTLPAFFSQLVYRHHPVAGHPEHLAVDPARCPDLGRSLSPPCRTRAGQRDRRTVPKSRAGFSSSFYTELFLPMAEAPVIELPPALGFTPLGDLPYR